MSLISSNTITDFTGVLWEHYKTFRENVIIHKSPIQTITDITANPLYGYGGENSNPANYTLTPVSGIFQVRVRYDNPLAQHSELPVREINVRIPKGGAIIDVTKETRDYILNGKTERIDTEIKSFNVVSDMGHHNYLGLKFYYFTLENTT